MAILVSGATGNIGSPLYKRLLSEGHDVRGGSRNPAMSGLPAANVVRFDLNDSETFGEALEGVDRVFLYAKTHTLDKFLDAAIVAGKPHVVLLSSCSVTIPGEEKAPYVVHHLACEREIISSGVPYTFLRPSDYPRNSYSNLDWAQTIREEGVVYSAYLDSQVTPIHELDIVDCAFAALTKDDFVDTASVITGPAIVTPRDLVAIIGDALGRNIVAKDISPEEAEERLVKVLDRASVGRQLMWWRLRMDDPTEVTHEVERITGTAARTMERWAKDHVKDFS